MKPYLNPIPAGYHTITPQLIVKGATEAIAFYKKAFGAKELMVMPGPGKHGIIHAELKIGNSIILLCDEYQEAGQLSPQALGGSPCTILLYVDNVDYVFHCAVAAGATVLMPLTDMFWGDRYGKLSDPFGHCWSVASRTEDISAEEMFRRFQSCFPQTSSR